MYAITFELDNEQLLTAFGDTNSAALDWGTALANKPIGGGASLIGPPPSPPPPHPLNHKAASVPVRQSRVREGWCIGDPVGR